MTPFLFFVFCVVYAIVGFICYAAGVKRGLKAGATITYKLMADGWLAKGAKWPKTEAEADALIAGMSDE